MTPARVFASEIHLKLFPPPPSNLKGSFGFWEWPWLSDSHQEAWTCAWPSVTFVFLPQLGDNLGTRNRAPPELEDVLTATQEAQLTPAPACSTSSLLPVQATRQVSAGTPGSPSGTWARGTRPRQGMGPRGRASAGAPEQWTGDTPPEARNKAVDPGRRKSGTGQGGRQSRTHSLLPLPEPLVSLPKLK